MYLLFESIYEENALKRNSRIHKTLQRTAGWCETVGFEFELTLEQPG
jgi:hypothetical protein